MNWCPSFCAGVWYLKKWLSSFSRCELTLFHDIMQSHTTRCPPIPASVAWSDGRWGSQPFLTSKVPILNEKGSFRAGILVSPVEESVEAMPGKECDFQMRLQWISFFFGANHLKIHLQKGGVMVCLYACIPRRQTVDQNGKPVFRYCAIRFSRSK